jgi:SAM-dependent methyltransferase
MATQTQQTIGQGLEFDNEAVRRIEAMYLHPDVVERRRRVREALAAQPGERVLDIGCGPGFLTGELAAEVGPDGWVCGIDISESGLQLARSRYAGQPLAAWTDFREGNATALPFPDASFDAAVVVQVYEYVHDMATALAELERVLVPGGRVVIVDTDWDSLVWHTSDRARMVAILDVWDEHLADPRLPRKLAPMLREAGFEPRRPGVITALNVEMDGYSQGLAGLVAAFVAGRSGITTEIADAWLEDLSHLDQTGAYFFSLDQYLFPARKPVA